MKLAGQGRLQIKFNKSVSQIVNWMLETINDDGTPNRLEKEGYLLILAKDDDGYVLYIAKDDDKLKVRIRFTFNDIIKLKNCVSNAKLNVNLDLDNIFVDTDFINEYFMERRVKRQVLLNGKKVLRRCKMFRNDSLGLEIYTGFKSG